MASNQPLESILEQALARYSRGESLEVVVKSFPGYEQDVEALLTMVRAIELDTDRVEPPREVLRAALTGGSVTKSNMAGYREGEDNTKGRILARDMATTTHYMWKIIVPVAAVVAVVLVIVAARPGGEISTLKVAQTNDPEELAFNQLDAAFDSYFSSEDELALSLENASAIAPASSTSDPLDLQGINADASQLNGLGVEQFLNEEDGLEADLTF